VPVGATGEKALHPVFEPVCREFVVLVGDAAGGFIDDRLGLEHAVYIRGGAPHVVCQCHCRAADDEQLRLDPAGIEFLAQSGQEPDDLLAGEREIASFAHTDTRESCSTMMPRAANSAGAWARE
jgi:hypothetical protein